MRWNGHMVAASTLRGAGRPPVGGHGTPRYSHRASRTAAISASGQPDPVSVREPADGEPLVSRPWLSSRRHRNNPVAAGSPSPSARPIPRKKVA